MAEIINEFEKQRFINDFNNFFKGVIYELYTFGYDGVWKLRPVKIKIPVGKPDSENFNYVENIEFMFLNDNYPDLFIRHIQSTLRHENGNAKIYPEQKDPNFIYEVIDVPVEEIWFENYIKHHRDIIYLVNSKITKSIAQSVNNYEYNFKFISSKGKEFKIEIKPFVFDDGFKINKIFRGTAKINGVEVNFNQFIEKNNSPEKIKSKNFVVYYGFDMTHKDVIDLFNLIKVKIDDVKIPEEFKNQLEEVKNNASRIYEELKNYLKEELLSALNLKKERVSITVKPTKEDYTKEDYSKIKIFKP